VKAWQDLRLVVPGKANGAGQFLVHTFSQGLALSALADSLFLGHFSGEKGRGKSQGIFPSMKPHPYKVARGYQIMPILKLFQVILPCARGSVNVASSWKILGSSASVVRLLPSISVRHLATQHDKNTRFEKV
jgi:hypothetical protein